MIIGVLAAEPAARSAVIVAMTASAARLGLTVRLLRPGARLAQAGLAKIAAGVHHVLLNRL